MQEPEMLELDFGNITALAEVNEILGDLPTESNFYSGLLFCKNWLEGHPRFDFKTSGSTGEPKLWVVTRNQLVDSIRRTSIFFKLEKGQNLYICLNTEYTGGKMMLARALQNKMRIVWVEASQDPFKHFPKDMHFSLVSLVPAQMRTLMQSEERETILKRIDTVLLGGAPVQAELKELLQAIEKPFIYETFGMTETLSHIAVKKINGYDAPDSFYILDGIEVDSDERGCLMARAEATNNKWIISNDLVELVDERHFIWKGRADNVVNSGGVKILLDELEQTIGPLLRAQGWMGDFMLGAKTDPVLGEKLVMYVEEDIDNPEKLLMSLKSQVPVFHAPKEIIHMEKLPRTHSGKLKRTTKSN